MDDRAPLVQCRVVGDSLRSVFATMAKPEEPSELRRRREVHEAEVLELTSPAMHRRVDEQGVAMSEPRACATASAPPCDTASATSSEPARPKADPQRRHGGDVAHLREHGVQQLVACAAQASPMCRRRDGGLIEPRAPAGPSPAHAATKATACRLAANGTGRAPPGGSTCWAQAISASSMCATWRAAG